MKPPTGCLELVEAASRAADQPWSAVGVCVHHFDPAPTQGTDLTVKFTLYDPGWIHGTGMPFRFFHRAEAKLPQIQDNGDVIILRNVRTQSFQGSPHGIGKQTASWVVLSARSVVESTCANGSDIRYTSSTASPSQPCAPSVAELQYAKWLVVNTNPANFAAPPKATVLQVEGIMKASGGTPTARRDKYRRLEELKLNKANAKKFDDGRPAFADLLGEVRRIYKGDYAKIEIFLTDYTTNPRLYNYAMDTGPRDGDEFSYTESHAKWPGPWGQMSIQVFCWDAHAAYASQCVEEGMFVRIRNCHIKLDPDERTIEAVCRGDRDEASKVNIEICQPSRAQSDGRLRELLERKRDYEKRALAEGLRVGPANSSKSSRDSMPVDGAEQAEAYPAKPKGTTKARTRRQKKAERKNLKIQSGAGAVEQTTVPAEEINTNVRCRKIEIPLKTIDDILDKSILQRQTPAGNLYYVPFQNCCYKSRVRVVDYWPDDIADFCVPRSKTHYEGLTEDEIELDAEDVELSLAQSNPSLVQWEWRFILLVEDASAGGVTSSPKKQLPLLVAAEDGEHLIREAACDLRLQPAAVDNLREKLFLLWGNLEEKKEERTALQADLKLQPSSRPFECLIKEYGVPLSDTAIDGTLPEYQRLFRMFGTTI